jgi:hypothetical protein
VARDVGGHGHAVGGRAVRENAGGGEDGEGRGRSGGGKAEGAGGSELGWAGKGEGGARLRVLVTSVPFSMNAGQSKASSWLNKLVRGCLSSTLEVESDGWKNYEQERRQLLEWMYQAGKPVLLLSADLHWAAVFNGSGVLEVTASPLVQVPLAPWETQEEMSRREHTLFLSYLRLHFGRVHINTQASSGGSDGTGGTVTVELHQGSWFGFSSDVLWSKTFDLSQLVPRRVPGA